MTDTNGAAATQVEATPPQFTAEHWRNTRRQLTPPTRIIGINTRGEFKEFITDNGARFTRAATDLQQLVTVGTTVQIQLIRTGNGELVTGLYLPEVHGWAWEMTNEELADYAKELAEAIHEQRMKVRLAMVRAVVSAMLQVLNTQPRFQKLGKESQDQLAEELAVAAVIAMETGPA